MKKSSDVNNSPVAILVIGTIFTVGGGLLGAFGFLKSKALIGVLGLGLLAIGLIILAYGILKATKLKKYKALYNDPNAHLTDAKFIKAKLSSYSSKSVGVGNLDIPTSINVYKKIIYSYVDETGVEHTVKSLLSYTPNQVEYLQNLGTFKVKCSGNLSAVVEEVPNENKHFNI